MPLTETCEHCATESAQNKLRIKLHHYNLLLFFTVTLICQYDEVSD